MSKEDMMNKISFALKDPILQMGFEVKGKYTVHC